jgi:hypothetical protein
MIAMPAIPRTRQKLREAHYFLDQLQACSSFAEATIGEFDFNLSAFLAASRSVTFALQAEQKATYDAWFGPWKARLSVHERELLDYMVQRRNEAQKQGRASVEQCLVSVAAADMHAIDRELVNRIIALSRRGEEPKFWCSVRFFAFGSRLRPVAEVYEEYLNLLSRLVSEFGASSADSAAPAP